MTKQRVLFLCTGNSARSQMAEALLRHLAPEAFDVSSAGTAPKGLHPLAVRAMAELGIDIASQRSKSVDEYLSEPFDYVITLCDDANESCPSFANARDRLHWGFEDPARATGDEDQQLGVFRRVRDEIRVALERFVASDEQGSE
ncbi:MAG: arsenate reductase ArsC [Dehalococcoidia bacterium]